VTNKYYSGVDSLKKNITVVEVSYEVANKVGGIYTVLVSKISNMLENVQNYHAIGPYNIKDSAPEFEHVKKPEKIRILHEMIEKKYGIKCYYGKWLVSEKPIITLVDPSGFKEKLNNVKKSLWDEYGIDSLNADSWFDEPVLWSKAVGVVLEEMIKARIFKNPVIHFHEWLTGAGMLHLKSRKTDVPTVFTTHSTVLGRAIAEVGREGLHEMIGRGIKEGKTIPDEKAYEYNVQAKHLMEKACALNSGVFTTVSETAGKECMFILGKKPDIILSNGLDMEKFPSMEELSDMHILYRDKIRRFIMSYFSPYYNIDVSNALFLLISGRHEIRNKGIDVFIDSLGKLNEKLKRTKSKKPVIAFIWIPAHTMERRPTVMEHLALFETMEENVETETEKMEERIIESFAKGKLPAQGKIFDEEFLDYMKKLRMELRKDKGSSPPLSPFVLEPENAIIKMLEKNSLLNRVEDKVKVIYYPTYISPVDGLLNMKYYNAMIGCHVGVFPSYYESWGYTPLEAAALGLQSITTDLSGFGKFIQHYIKAEEYSIVVIPREGKGYGEVVNSLTDTLFKICKMNRKQRFNCKMRAKNLSTLSDWSRLITNYLDAYDLALKR